MHMNTPPVYSSRVRTPQLYNTNFHLHENYEIYLLIDGTLDYFVEHTCYRLTPGSLVLFDDRTLHKCSSVAGAVCERITVHFSPDLARSLSTDTTDLLACFETVPQRNNLLHLSPRELEECIDLCSKIVELQADRRSGTDVLKRAALMELLVFVNRCFAGRRAALYLEPPVKVTSMRLRPMLEYIEAHISEPLSLDALAEGLSVSKSHISHVFKEELGSTPSRYITTRRVVLAKYLLRGGSTVTEACMLSGFNDYANFIRVFKAATGIPPGQYRKNMLTEKKNG